MRALPSAAALLAWVACLSCSFQFHPAQASDNYLVPYEETQETYVEWPQDSASQTLLQTRPPGSIPPITMSLWTTAVDFRHPLFYLVLGIVRRLDTELIRFQPQYLLTDGMDNGCRSIDPSTGQEQETMDNVGCQKNCTNHGRYCAASLPKDPILAAKISGAAIVEESLRRLCGECLSWVYRHSIVWDGLWNLDIFHIESIRLNSFVFLFAYLPIAYDSLGGLWKNGRR